MLFMLYFITLFRLLAAGGKHPFDSFPSEWFNKNSVAIKIEKLVLLISLVRLSVSYFNIVQEGVFVVPG